MRKRSGQKGYTFIEIIVASLIVTLLVAAVVNYHTSSGAGKNQEYYQKAVQVARAEMEKLRALYDVDSGCSEFYHTGPPPVDIFLFKWSGSGDTINLPSPIYNVYYTDHGTSNAFLRGLGDTPPYSVLEKSGVSKYHEYYCEAYNNATFKVTEGDGRDRRTYTYFTWDNSPGYPPHAIAAQGLLDASLVVIDDMGSPYDCADDLLGNIGWWVEDVAISGLTYSKKVTFVLQFWYPGQGQGVDPEVIVLKTTLAAP